MDTMKCEKEKCNHCLKMCLKIAKVVLSAATVATMVCMVKEIHRVHRAIEDHHKGRKF